MQQVVFPLPRHIRDLAEVLLLQVSGSLSEGFYSAQKN